MGLEDGLRKSPSNRKTPNTSFSLNPRDKILRNFIRSPSSLIRKENNGEAFFPKLGRVLVEKILQPSKTVSGTLLPKTSSQLNSWRVIACGPGARDRTGNLIPVSVKEGDNVLLPGFAWWYSSEAWREREYKFGGTQVRLGEKEFLLYRDEDLALHD